jgi:hypothetical protein
MKTSKIIFTVCAFFLILVLPVFMFFTTKTQEIKAPVKSATATTPQLPIIVGATYQLDFTFDNNDPFAKKIIYTVIVLDRKAGYVKYKYLEDTTTTSCEESFFIKKSKYIR